MSLTTAERPQRAPKATTARPPREKSDASDHKPPAKFRPAPSKPFVARAKAKPLTDAGEIFEGLPDATPTAFIVERKHIAILTAAAIALAFLSFLLGDATGRQSERRALTLPPSLGVTSSVALANDR